MIEIHSNFTVLGSTTASDGLSPTDRALRETLEITQGLALWSEIGFYCFTTERGGDGYMWVGTHIRPRVRAPEETWSIEIRPIIDARLGGERGSRRHPTSSN